MHQKSSLLISDLMANINPVRDVWREEARQRLDRLTKPPGSLGRLEGVAEQYVAIRRDRWQEPIRKGAYIFAADHGVTVAGVSAYPSEVTNQMILNFLSGGAAINVLARLHHVDLSIIDVGVIGDFGGIPGLLHHKVMQGTRNWEHESAMTDEELALALAVGLKMSDSAVESGHNLVAVGEMGIGNTTSASAITSALTGTPASVVTGRGTGVNTETYVRKVAIVEAAVAKYFPDLDAVSPLYILQCVGGLEIASIVGTILQAARHELTIVIDGFIVTAAAAIAIALVPACRDYMIAGHRSEEPGHGVLLDYLDLQPLLSLNMRLGEGTGAVLALPIIESAIALYREMATFASAGVSEASE